MVKTTSFMIVQVAHQVEQIDQLYQQVCLACCLDALFLHMKGIYEG